MKKRLLKTMLLLCALIVGSGSAWADDVTTTYVFTNKSWGATCNGVAANWTSGQDGNQLTSGQGIQITTAVSGANGTSPTSFTNVSQIVVRYCTNASKGAGTIKVQVGSGTEKSFSVTKPSSGGTTLKDATFTFSTPETGSVKVTGDCTSNSVYIYSVAITTTSSSTPTCATPTFSPGEGTYTSTQNVMISTETTGATIYYTTDGNDPTTSSSVYSSAISVSSNTTIKAIATKSNYDNSDVATAAYTIVSLVHAGTEQDPYTVADARNAIDANTGVTSVYATGVVSEIVEDYSSQHSNITFDFIDEGGSNTLRAYRCSGTDAADIQVGDVVVVSGSLTKFGDIYEFSQGCTLVSRTSSSSKESAGLAYSSASAEADLADLSSFTAPTLSNPNGLEVTYESTNTTVATVASDGTVTPLAKGTTTIKATSEETNDYLAGVASYTLTVTNSNAVLVTVDSEGNITFDLSDNAWNFPTSKQVDEGSYINNGYTIKVAGSTGQGFYFDVDNLLIGKSGAYLSLPAFEIPVEKIVVEGGGEGASGYVTQNIFVNNTAVSTQTTSAKVTHEYEIDENYRDAGNVYTLKVTNGNNTRVSKIIVYKGTVDERTPVTLTFTGVPATIVKDETATYAVSSSPVVTGITYSSSDDNIVTVDSSTGEIEAVALGTATITATFAGDTNYKPATASYEIEVVAPQHTAKFFVNGVEQTAAEVQVSEGAAITFPSNPTDIAGKTFVGWAEATINGITDNAPTLVTSATMGNADKTFYAVFATVSGGGTTTATLTESEIRANFTNVAMAYNDNEKSYNDTSDGITWAAKAYATANAPWIQLRKNNSVAYLKINAAGNISNLKFTISNTTNETGTSTSEISNHGAFSGYVILLNEPVANAIQTTEGILGSTNSVSNNVVNITPTSSVNEVYVQVTAAARIWGVEVTYGSSTASGYCTTVTGTITLNSACNDGDGNYYGTYSNTNGFVVPEGLTVAEVGIDAENKLVVEPYATGAVVPANTGVMVSSTTDGDHEIVLSTGGTSVLDDDNCLRPTGNGITAEAMAAADASCKYYRLTMHNGTQIGFWWGAAEGAAFDLAANKAYLAVPSGQAARVMGFSFDSISTSVNGVGTVLDMNAPVYNVLGQRVSPSTKGILIQNGKKFINK